jgi:DNA-binding NarL/FixJ family response regulator
MVKDALQVGGHGYVAKIDAGHELLKAIHAVRDGKQFVSQRILTQGWEMDPSEGAEA